MCSNYRALGLLNHSYKILSICLLNRLVKETSWFLSDWQSGFRAGRGCRDNLLLLRVLYDHIIRGDKQCAVTFIDFEAAFDSVSHKYLDKALEKAGASRKTRAIFRAIYKAAQGAARIRGVDGKIHYSKWFDIQRGVIQGDIISPVLFILALDQLVQSLDKGGQGVKVTIHELRVLGYADDAALTDETVTAMTKRLTLFANESRARADMKVKPTKTFTQIVQRQTTVATPTAGEIEKVEAKYKHKCPYSKEGCKARFKTKHGMMVHRASCNFGYSTTEKKFKVEKITAVFGKSERKLYKVRWQNYPDPSEDTWETEQMLLEYGCQETIDARRPSMSSGSSRRKTGLRTSLKILTTNPDVGCVAGPVQKVPIRVT